MGVVKHVGAAITGDETTVIEAATTKAARPALPVYRLSPTVFNFWLFMAGPIVVEMRDNLAGQFGPENAGSTCARSSSMNLNRNNLSSGYDAACLLVAQRSIGTVKWRRKAARLSP